VAKLVDALDLGSSGVTLGSSSLPIRTNIHWASGHSMTWHGSVASRWLQYFKSQKNFWITLPSF